MQTDQLLQRWKEAKQICNRVILISRQAHLPRKYQLSQIQKLTKIEFMSVYDIVYQLCVTKEKEQSRVSMVYKQFKDILKEALMLMCQDLHLERDIYKLDLLTKIWNAYTEALKKLNHMFAYLNRPFHIKEGKIQQLQKTGYEIIFSTLFNENVVKEYQLIYFKELAKIRQSKNFSNADIMKSIVQILYTKHTTISKQKNKQATVYTDFYNNYSRAARQYYGKTFKKLCELNPSQYFKQIEKIYDLEMKISDSCFGMLGEGLFSRQFSQQFISKYRQILLTSNKGFKSILKNKQFETLKIIVQMLQKFLKNVDIIKYQFQQFVYEEMLESMNAIKYELLNAGKNNPHINRLNQCKFMQRVIQINEQLVDILKQSFMQIIDFANSYKCGIEKAFKSLSNQIPLQQILAVYADSKLKTSTLRQDELSYEVTSIISIFSCLESKDLFLKKYTNMLCKRITLLNNELGNHQSFIQNLKMNCGMGYTQKLQILLTELEVSLENHRYLQQVLDKENIKIAVSLKVFREGVWPTQEIVNLSCEFLPPILQSAYNSIMKYYDSNANKKILKISFLESKIRWTYFLQKQAGNTLQQCYFDTNSLQGIIVYYIYMKRPKPVNIKQIEQYLIKVATNVIKQNLHTLSQMNQKLLLRKEVDGQIMYQFNTNMKTKKRLINYDTTILEEQEKLMHHDLSKDREIVLDANISKYMKSRKITTFQFLEGEIIKMIKIFTPSRRDIKNSIDRLISKDIIKRDEKDSNTIKYMQ